MTLTITRIKNLKEVPLGVRCVAVRAENDKDALRELEFIAKRDGRVLTGTVYAWSEFYYAVEAK